MPDKKTKINAKYFRDLMQDRGLNVITVAKKLGMTSHASLSLVLSGARKMQLSEAVGLSQMLGVPLADVVANAGYPLSRNTRGAAVIGILRGDGSVEAMKDNLTRTLMPDGLPPNVAAIQARTADTPLGFMDRWVFFCDDQEKPTDASIGKFCLIGTGKDRMRIGVLRRGYDAGSFGINGPDQKAESIRVNWIRPILLTRNG